jgi:hypothetical protein
LEYDFWNITVSLIRYFRFVKQIIAYDHSQRIETSFFTILSFLNTYGVQPANFADSLSVDDAVCAGSTHSNFPTIVKFYRIVAENAGTDVKPLFWRDFHFS